MTLATICRCGLDIRVRTGAYTFCTHCDSACTTPGTCPQCATLRRTCNDCRRTHATESARAECERTHSS